jgi:hypothetical protein
VRHVFRPWLIGDSRHGFDPLAGEPFQSFFGKSLLTLSRARNFRSPAAFSRRQTATNQHAADLCAIFVSSNVEFAFKKMSQTSILGQSKSPGTGSGGSPSMDIMEFHVCQQGRSMRWIVRLDNTTYGAYLDKEQAMLDALEAARDARQAGRDARVFLRDQTDEARIF